jgi:hypothetical protein
MIEANGGYDIDQLKDLLPFVKQIRFRRKRNDKAGTRVVEVTSELTNGATAVIECHEMPPSTNCVVQMIRACCHQIVHPFTISQTVVKDGATRIQKREADGTVHAAPPKLLHRLTSGLPGLGSRDLAIESVAQSLDIGPHVCSANDDGCLVDRAGDPIVSDDGLTLRSEPSLTVKATVEVLSDEDADELIRELDEADAAISAISSSVDVINE